MGIDYSVADYVEPRLGQVWRESRDHFDTFLHDIELPNELGTRALSIWPQPVADPAEYLRRWPDIEWTYLSATGPDGPVAMMFIDSRTYGIRTPRLSSKIIKFNRRLPSV